MLLVVRDFMNSLLTKFKHSGTSHIGPIREDNQDAIHLPDDNGSHERGWVYAVADGMGGFSHGRVASQLALQMLFRTFYEDRESPVPKALRRGVELANLAVYKEAQRLGTGRMGTTLTAACIRGNQLVLAHVGDSRAYLIRGEKAICLTDDHTRVGELVRMKVLSPHKVRTHAQRSILTRGIGLGLFVQPDIVQHTLQPNDRIVLCSDGLWCVIEDDEFAYLASRALRVEEYMASLIQAALDRQTDDNISVITIHIESFDVETAQPTLGTERKRSSFALKNLFSRAQVAAP